MKCIVEFTEQQINELNEERGDLPMPSFLKSVFKFKSVEVIEERTTEATTSEANWLYDDLYDLDVELGSI